MLLDYCAFVGSLNNEFSLNIPVTFYNAGWKADSVIIIYDFQIFESQEKVQQKTRDYVGRNINFTEC